MKRMWDICSNHSNSKFVDLQRAESVSGAWISIQLAANSMWWGNPEAWALRAEDLPLRSQEQLRPQWVVGQQVHNDLLPHSLKPFPIISINRCQMTYFQDFVNSLWHIVRR